MDMLIVAITFVAVAVLTALALYPVISRRSVVTERLAALRPEQERKAVLTVENSWWQQQLDRLGMQMPLSASEQSRYVRMLVAAGIRRERIYIFFGAKLLAALLLPAIFIGLYSMPQGQVLQSEALLVTVALAIVGYLTPTYWLRRRVQERQREIFYTLPDVLDLLTICVEAGLGLDAAFIRACESPHFAGNPLINEMKIVAMETRAGKPRYDALRDMANRTMEDDLKAFVGMLIQTDRFGTSLSLALRVHSDSLRTKRRQLAEEAAAKTTIKILFPLLLCIFPALLIIIIGPALFKIADIFK